MSALDEHNAAIVDCRACPRLVKWRETVEKRASYADQEYWRRPLPGFGDPRARLVVVGLAPAAHGGNRTGRVFTGDRSGDWLYRALHKAGFANQPVSIRPGDGLKLTRCYISATARCAPPANKPLPTEVANCATYLDREWDLLRKKRVLLALGKIAWDAAVALAVRHGCVLPKPRPAFGHGAVMRLSNRLTLVGSYHVSQQNTFTGKLTEGMFDEVMAVCSRAISDGRSRAASAP